MTNAWKRLLRRRPYALAVAAVLVVMLAGDKAQLAPPPGIGIDPFEVLDQQVRNNVLIVLDTSGSMKWPIDRDNFTLGADDPSSRMYQAKAAIRAVVQANQDKVNFGLVSYNALATDKNLNETQNYEGDGRIDGPFVYVTADGTAARRFHRLSYTSNDDPATGESEAFTGFGFFSRISNTFANYDGTNSGDVWRSFMNRDGGNQPTAYSFPYPTGCADAAGQLSPLTLANPASMRCRWYMQSRLLRNGVRYTWNRATSNVTLRLTATTPITCPAPPAGLLGHSFTPPCFQIEDAATPGVFATYYYSSTIFQQQQGSSCGGGALIAGVAPCDGNNAPLVLAQMDPELPVTPAGTLNGVPAASNANFDFEDGHLDGDQTLPTFGLRADQATPLAGTLDFIRTVTNPSPAFPVQAVRSQKNFVILVTDGDDTCADGNTDRAAVIAAQAAENLYRNFDPQTQAGDFRHWAETLVVGFASAVNPARINVIAQGGSGAIIDGSSSNPATAATCPPGVTCRNAFFASSTQQLIDILNAALEQASSTGIFSATPSVFDSVPEYVHTVVPSPPASPFPSDAVMDPDLRYRALPFRSYRGLFEAGGFRGVVRAFDEFGAIVPNRPSPAPPAAREWEAGQRLIDPDRMSADLDAGAAGADHTFSGLMGPTSAPGPAGGLPAAETAFGTHIHRRIFTTRQNGARLGAADDPTGAALCGGPCRVNLWPPDPAVAPGYPNYTDYSTAGILDERLFRKPDGTPMTLVDFQGAPLRACMGANLPAACTGSPLAAARKEAREMILAYTAGAEPRRDGSGNPIRDASGHIVYRRRAWVLAESTLATPALVTQPINIVPSVHTQEYLLYRDGPRDLPSGQSSGGDSDAFIRRGFGLRHPDRDGREQPAGPMSRPNLKPVMSVLYVPSNDMLHAYRAAPCPGTGLPCGDESGGEELWAFVPHDLLPKLKDRMKPQTRTDHTFMLSASLRFADVFVPGNFSLSVSGRTYNLTGRWRRLMLFGRGLGGKYLTALDITDTGSMTRASLHTKLPAVLWNRGNPDTDTGLTSGTRNGTSREYNEYLDMGMTWSTPNIARVSGTPEFVAYVGSGYSTGDPREGTRFYTLNALNGDIVASADVGEGSQTAFQNALVASPVIYSSERLVSGLRLPHPSQAITRAVYIGDIHGRLWKFDSADPATPLLFRNLGPDQPMGVSPALLNLGRPHVFVVTGRDARVPVPASGFMMFGFEDAGPPYPAGVVSPPLSAPEFALAFPPIEPGKGEYRGTVAPVTAFQGSAAGGEGVVFFTGTRFNPVASGRCVSTFDSTVLGLFARTGGAAYATQECEGCKVIAQPRVPDEPGPPGTVQGDKGTGVDGNPPDASLPPPPAPAVPALVTATNMRPGSTVCR